MRKLLLSGLAVLAATAAMGAHPTIVENAYITKFSNDGKYFASFVSGCIGIYETETGELVASFGGEDMPYSLGDGTCFANDGTFIGGTPAGAAYCKDFEWTNLNVPHPEFSSYAQSITPDGKYIVGMAGMAPISTDDTAIPMMVPVYWELQADGTYSDAKELPYPALDFTGRVPQYVTAYTVSDDGSKIFGQIQDYGGAFVELIVYTRKSDNTWEYSVAQDLVNPNHVQFPEWPGENPEYPNIFDYMTEEEINNYNEAVENWDYTSGDPFPEYQDFMTEEEINNWDAALSSWQIQQNIWYSKFEAFQEVYEQVQMEGRSMLYNNLFLSKDYKTVFTTTTFVEEDPNSWTGFKETRSPMLINAETFEATVKTPKNVTAICVTDDNTIFGFTESLFRSAVIYAPDADEPVSLATYYESKPEIASWIEENMYHDAETFNWETGEFETLYDCEFTGTPVASANGSLVATAVSNDWDYELPVGHFTYILPGLNSGVKNIMGEAADLKISTLKNGRILIGGHADSLTVFDINGVVVFTTDKPAGIVETGLESGAYIIKASAESGTQTVKAMF